MFYITLISLLLLLLLAIILDGLMAETSYSVLAGIFRNDIYKFGESFYLDIITTTFFAIFHNLLFYVNKFANDNHISISNATNLIQKKPVSLTILNETGVI